MKKILYFLMLAVALAACDNSAKDINARLAEARSLYKQGDIFGTRLAIDSLRSDYPRKPQVLRECLKLMRQVDLKEAQRNIAFCDSLIPIKLQEADSIKNHGFTFEKDSRYETVGNFIWKGTTVERNVQRSYIRSGVDEKGNIYIASVYYGAKPINHTGIKLSTPDGQSIETAAIPYDGGLNFHFTDMGYTTEVVTYKAEKGIDAIKLIAANPNARIKVEYTGGRPFVIYMETLDKQSVTQCFRLASTLNDVEKMKAEKDKCEKKVEYINKRLLTNK